MLCVCVFQYITSVYWVGHAAVVESVWALPSGVTVWRTVLMERMNLSAVRPLNQHSIFSLTLHISDDFGDWTLIFLFRKVRLYGTDFILQSYSSENQAWMPVCAENWNDNHGKSVCEHLGYRRLSSPLFASVRWLDCLIFRYLMNYGEQMWNQWCAFSCIFSGWPAGGSVRLESWPYLSTAFLFSIYIVYGFICSPNLLNAKFTLWITY